MAKHVDDKTLPTQDEVKRWHEWIFHAAPVYWALESACEDLVEDGSTDERVAAIKQALAQAQGLSSYWARNDRW